MSTTASAGGESLEIDTEVTVRTTPLTVTWNRLAAGVPWAVSRISWSNWSSTSFVPESASVAPVSAGAASGRPTGFCATGPSDVVPGFVQKPWAEHVSGVGEVRVAV